MSASDHDLLKQYADNGASAQAAFATLVGRHLNLVYSVARRHGHSRQLAEEIAQSVFVDLARKAGRIDPQTPLVAWLHLVSRRTAIDVIRRESRRQARETAAAALADMKTPSPWTEVEPLLDEAVESLPASDRSAILLRYFENKSLREVGVALGASEDAAQKRVSRALDQLRQFFARRGVSITASALAADLSSRAVEAAPTSLAVAISTSKAISAAAETLHTLAMTTVQKTLVAAAFALVLGGSVFEARVISQQRREIAALRQQNDHVATRIADRGRHQALATGASIPIPAAAPATEMDPALLTEANALLGRMRRVQELLDRHPEWTIPEMQLLTEDDWFERARRSKFDTSDDVAEFFMAARGQSKARFAVHLMQAGNAYVKANDGRLPSHARELLPYVNNPAITESMLDRYAVRYTGAYADLPPGERSATFIEITSPDEARDQRIYAGPGGARLRDFRNFADDAAHALRMYAAAKAGATPASPNELVPFFNPPLSAERQLKFIETGSAFLPKP